MKMVREDKCAVLNVCLA
uniref:Uncharacterized protein n=1 Tax=Anguilla anguilla TaxID=7936 RepID=A0A0E9V209_ANGAN